VVAGSFAQRNAENVVTFPTKRKGRYLLVRALSEVNGRPWTSIAELRPLAELVYGPSGAAVSGIGDSAILLTFRLFCLFLMNAGDCSIGPLRLPR